MIALEGISSMWIVGILAFLLGTTLGCIAAWLIVSRENKTQQLEVELNELKGHFTDYRDQVTRHFMQTSSLVQTMTDSYRDVYEHLASGAKRLCDVDEGGNQLYQAKPEEIEHPEIEHPEADAVEMAAAGFDYDELEELSRIRSDIDQLMGESPHIPDSDSKAEAEDKSPLQH